MSQNLAYHDNSNEENLRGLRGADIIWKPVDGKGRGVFTTRNIKKGELIEVAPAVPVADESFPEDEAPDGYLLEWDEDTEGEEYAMIMGYVMLYNHSDKPNIELELDLGEYVANVTAIRDIKAGEELVWRYHDEVWFATEE